MDNSHFNDQTNEDVFLLDRDQPAQLGQRPGTPPPNYNLINTAQHTITYEIIKTEDIHVVLVHEQPLVNAINVENEHGVIRRFTTDNPVIPDDEFVSPIRRFNPADRYSPNYRQQSHEPIQQLRRVLVRKRLGLGFFMEILRLNARRSTQFV